MDPLTLLVIENALAVRTRLLAHVAAVRIAAHAVDDAIATLPTEAAASWRGPAAREEVRRVRELAHALEASAAQLRVIGDRLAHQVREVELHVG